MISGGKDMKRMKMMKKAAIWMLTASMAAGLTACGGSGAEVRGYWRYLRPGIRKRNHHS